MSWSNWLPQAFFSLVAMCGATPALAAIALTVDLTGPATYTPGSPTASTYVLVLGNTGSTTETGSRVTTDFPGSAAVSWVCAAAGTNTSCRSPPNNDGNGNLSTFDPGNIAQNGTLTYTFTVTFASSTTTSPLVVNAQITSSDATPVVTSDSHSSTRNAQSNLGVVWVPATAGTYVPGSTGNALTFRVSNAGPTDSSAATVALSFPAAVSGVSWACNPLARCSPSSGTGTVATAVTLVSGAGVDIDLTSISYLSSATADPLNLTATVTAVNETDGTAGNNSATKALDRDPRTNLGVAFTPSEPIGSPGTYIPGSTGNALAINVTNAGPTNSGAAPVTMNFPPEVSSVSWSCSVLARCSPSTGTGNVSTSVTLASGAGVDINLVIAYRSSALTSPLDLVASIAAASGETDSTAANNSATNRYTIDRRADVRVVKTGPSAVNPSSAFVYQITVSNAGPSDVGNGPAETGALLSDAFAPQLQGDQIACSAAPATPCWEFCPSDNGVVGNYTVATCPVEVVRGSGNIVDRGLRLRAGSSSVATVFVSLGGSASGSISNTATVRITDAGVADPGAASNNTSTVNSNIVISTDLAVVKTDNATSAVPGQTHSYRVTVSNNGFVTANNVAVQDTLPLFAGAVTAGFVPGTISWQCSAFNGACCNTNSAVCGVGTPTPAVTADVLSAAVDLPGQSRLEFTVTGRLHARASGTLNNSATATLPAGVTETDTSNNTGRDNNTLLVPQGSPTISKTLTSLQSLGAGGVGPPFRLNYRILVGNGGPSFMAGATVSDPLISPLLVPATASWTCVKTADPAGNTRCVQAGGTGALSLGVDLDPDGAVQIDLTVDTTSTASGEVVNTAEINSAAGNASATLTSGLSGEANLSLTKTDLKSSAIPGDETDYVITVSNAGPDDVFGAVVRDAFPPELENVSWTCTATTPVPGDLSEFSTVGAANTGGNALATSSDGRHVYVAGTAANAVFAFQRDNVPGLTFGSVAALETETEGVNDPLDGGAAVSGMATPIDVVLSPDGAMLYVLSQTAVAAFNRVTNVADPNFGKLSFAGSVTTGMPATPRRIVATAQNIYVSGAAVVSVYRRDQVSGLPVHDVQHSADMPAAPGALAVSTVDSLLFVGSSTGQQVVSFAINTVAGAVPVGRLTLVATLNDADLAGIGDLVLAPAERHLYVAAGTAARIVQLTYSASALSKAVSYSAADLTVPAGQPDPLSGTLRLALAPDGEHLLSVNLGVNPAGSLLQLRRDVAAGGLAFEALLIRNVPAGGHLGLSQAADVAFTSDGRHVLVASASTATRPLTVYARRAPDPLFAFIERDRQGDPIAGGGTLAGLTAVADVVVSPDGRHVYAVGLQGHALTAFNRNSNSGDGGDHLVYLASYTEGVSGAAGLQRPSAVQISPDGRSVYVTSEDNNSLAVFDRNNDDASAGFGRLAFRQVLRDGVGGVDGLLGARAIAVDRDSRHLYVAGSFESAIAIFTRNADLSLSFAATVRSGTDGVTGLNGIRDLVVTRDGAQVLGVSAIANAVVVFNRERNSASPNFGRLSFVQARVLGASDRLVSLAIPASPNASENEHVYVVAESSNRIYVLRRILDPGSASTGTVQPLFQYANNTGGITRMSGPRDVQISPDGERIHVAAQFGNSVLVFERDSNRSSAGYGGLSLLETRSDGVDGVDGINSVYALAISPDSRNVYAAGFGDNAVASFVVGTGSSCSASGSGDIADTVDIGAGGTLVYRAHALIRPDAIGTLSNTATVALPPRFTDNNLGNNTQTDSTTLTPRADLSVTKTNGRVSVVAGETVEYEVVVRNAGLSNIIHSGAAPFTLTDIFGSGFAAGTAQWSCIASGSGALEYVDGYFEDRAGITGLTGVGGMALVKDLDGAGPLAAYLATVSVLDGALDLFVRDRLDGRLTLAATIAQGTVLNGTPVDALAGARSVAASRDGRFLYVASRTSDSVSVFRLSDNGAGQLRVDLVQVQRNMVGLDQALHVVLSPDAAGQNVYVAGANDDAIAVFSRDPLTGLLTWIESEQNGFNDAGDAGGTVAGLDNVEFLAASPDGRHVYALSGSGGSVSVFQRDPATGRLSWRNVVSGNDIGESMAGASSAVFDATGEFLYVTAADANRVLVLGRDANSASGTFGDLAFASSVVQGVAGTQGLLAPSRAALTADGAHLYVTASSGGSVAWFIRDPADGGLTFLGLRSNESAGVDGLAGATDVVVDDVLNQVYVAGTQQDAVAQFERQIDSFCPTSGSGDLNAIPLRIAAGGSVTFRITVQVTNGFSGSLQNTATLTSSQDTNPSNNQATDTDTVSAVADLAITKSDGLAEFDGLDGAVALAGDDRQLYVAGAGDNAIGIYDRTSAPGPAHGSIAFNSVLQSGVAGVVGLAGISDIMLSADGAHVYATSPTDSSVATFRRNRTTGALSFVELEQNGVLGVTGLSGAQALAQSPDGSHVYAAGAFSNAIATFARETNAASADYGRLQFKAAVQNGVGGVDGIGNPIALIVAPDGRHVYALGAANDSVAVFVRNPNSGSSTFGQLTFVARYLNNQGGFTGLGGVRSLLMNAAGTNLYVLGAENGNIARLARDTVSGALTPAQVLAGGTAGGLAGASRMHWSPGEQHIYAAGTQAAAVAFFAVNAGDGNVSFLGRIANGNPAPLTGGQVLGLAGVRDVLVSPDGGQLYSVSDVDDAASTFERTAADGSLSFRGALFDGLGGVAPGESVTYLIAASNNGPSNVVGATVVDRFPDAFSQVSWTCTSSGGASCLPSGTGSINTPVNLPVGGRVVFVATGVVGESAAGRLINTATISSNGNLDPVASNNTATDGDTVLSPAMDLVVSVTDGAAVSVPGDRVDYSVAINNLGPTYASGASVRDAIPPALHAVAWTCDAVPVAGALSLAGQLVGATTTHAAIAVGSLGNFVYTVGQRGGQGVVLAYQRNPLDGALSELAAYQDGAGGISGLGGAVDLILSGDERFLYVAGAAADAIALFARDTATGTLSFVRQYQDGVSGVDGLGGVRSLLMAPGGLHLYAAGALDDAIAVFSVNAATGLLTQSGIIRQTDPGVDGLGGVADLAWINNGTHLLAVASDNQSLAAFARNAASGALSLSSVVQDFQFPANPGVLVGPTKLSVFENQVFVAATGGNRVSRFLFTAGATPAFALDVVIANGQGGVAGMQQPRGLVFDPDQARLYVASGAPGALHIFSLLGAQPQLIEQRAAGGFPVLGGATALALAHNGRQLYTLATAPSGGLGWWARERGSRCAISGETQLGTQVVDIAPGGSVTFSIGGDIFANALGNLVYSVSAGSRVAAEELNPADNTATDTNALQPSPDLAIAKTDGLSQIVAGAPIRYTIALGNAGVSDALLARVVDNAPLFPSQPAGLLSGSGEWSCSANLPLAFTRALTEATQPALTGVGAMVLSRDGTQLFAVNPTTGALLVFPRQPDGTLGGAAVIQNGTVLGDTTVDGMAGASNLALTRDGRHLLVTAATANSLLVFSRDALGVLRFRQKLTSGTNGVAGLLGAADVVVSADGRHVFVASTQANAIAVFTRNPDTGVLGFVERVADGLGTIVPDSNVIKGVRRLHLSDDGLHLYAVAGLSGALSRFAVNPATGVLTYRDVRRSVDAGLGSLAGARDLVAAPGDSQLYALGTSGIVQFNRNTDGALAPAGVVAAIPGLGDARALSLDAFGSRLYLSDAGGSVHVFARDWSNGALDHRLRFTVPGGALAAPNELLHVAGTSDLYVASSTPGNIAQLDELALSRCLTPRAAATQVATEIDLGATGWAQLLFDARVHPSARGVLSNTASVQPGAGTDPSASNNTAADTTNITVVSDLSISKVAPAQAAAGGPISYRIEVRNLGPSDALGVQILDALDPALLGATWTCSSNGASTCPATGNGNINVTTNVLAGNVLTFVVSARTAPNYLGPVRNQASLVPEPVATDPTPGDHVAQVQTDVVAVADVSITKANGVARVTAGTAVRYQIDVANAGPSNAPLVRIVDLLPGILVAPTWTCSGTGGGTCPASGSGNVDFVAVMPTGARLRMIVDAMLSPAASGLLENAATAEVLGGVRDPQVANNAAVDSDPVAIAPDLALQIIDPLDPFDPAGTIALPYEIRVTNAGPSDAHAVVVDLSLSIAAQFTPPAACVVLTSLAIRCDFGTVVTGTTRSLSFAFEQFPPASASFGLQGLVTTVDDDPVLANNAVAQTTQFASGANLRISINDDRTSLRVGDLTTYRITVENVGSQPASGVAITALIAPELVDTSWNCTPTTGGNCGVQGAGTGDLRDTIALARGQNAVYLLRGYVDPNLDVSRPRTVVQQAKVSAAPGVDINLVDNAAEDIDFVITPALFADGFENATPVAAADPSAAAACADDGVSGAAAGKALEELCRSSGWGSKGRWAKQD